MATVLKIGSRTRFRPMTILAVAILGTGFTAFHSEIFSSAAWAFERVTDSFLIQYINNIGLGIGACFG